MKKGRHRRFEEARALKRGPDIDIESILDDPNARAAQEDAEFEQAERERWGIPADE